MTTSVDDFYRTNRVDAVRWAAALVGRRDVAEELAQDALVRTGERLQQLDQPVAYLRRAVVNACQSWHRTSGREERRNRRIVAAERDAPDNAGNPGIDLSVASSELLAALKLLPYGQRAALVLRFWADWSDADVADSLGCKPASVRVLIHRGLASLRKELDQ